MRVESRTPHDPELERIAVVPDSVEDLWHLQYVIEPGDRVATEISRRIQRDDDHMRDTGGSRETMWAVIAVEETEFDRFAERLRIGGPIIACSREDEIGHHHTINAQIHDELELEKRFKPDQTERLQEAQAATAQPDVLVVTVEEGRADVFDVAQHGADHRATLTAGSGKREGESTRTDLFAAVSTILGRSDADAIVLAGPGFTKDDCASYVLDALPDLEDRLRTVDTSAVGERGVREVLSRGVIDDVRAESRLAQESMAVDTLLERLRTDPSRVTYGPNETARAAEYGAVDTLCLVDDKLRSERANSGDWSIDVDAVIESVERQGGDVTIVSASGEPGRQLEGLGGIAAILRFPIDG